MNAIVDSGFVIAVASPRDKWHKRCVEVYDQQQGVLFLPQPALSEIAHLVVRIGGYREMINFLKNLPKAKYQVAPLLDDDIQRTAEVLEKYVDSRLDFVDAGIIALAERLNINRILTIDRRDFLIVRPRHIKRFDVLP